MKIGNKKRGMVYVPENDATTVAIAWFVGGFVVGGVFMCIVWAYAGG